jgi:hypothetical protein
VSSSSANHPDRCVFFISFSRIRIAQKPVRDAAGLTEKNPGSPSEDWRLQGRCLVREIYLSPAPGFRKVKVIDQLLGETTTHDAKK